MKNPSKISHPLKNRTGTSQRTRIKQALQFDSAPIDGKTLADRLYLISEYAQQINFYEYDKNAIENQELTNWVSFFKNSLPFRLAIFSKASIDNLESEYNLLAQELKVNPSKQSLESLLEFIFNKIITPVTVLFNTVDKAENSFTIPLSTLIRSNFVDPLKSFISLYNSSVTFLCIGKKNFASYMTSPWLLKVDEVYALDSSIQQVSKGKKEAFLKTDKILNTIFYQMLSGLDSIIQIAPDYIEESLIPLEESLQKKHESHLALLFTFLELFKHFQGNINELGKKHLDFFYEKVLKMIPKAAVPDKAHIVFEVAKHLDVYPLSKDLLLKDGKDLNKQDIRFGLDHEIILDKAKVTDLRTFSLYPAENNSELIEGVYMAPVANSVDGKGKKFKENEANNWATLGSKYSKTIKEVAGDPIVENHPNARLGFVLASPVLLLEEGKRTINFILECRSEVDFIEKISEIYDVKNVYEIPENIFESFNNVLPELSEGDSDQEKQDKIEFRIIANEFFKDLISKKVNNNIYKEDFDAFLLINKPDNVFDFFPNDIKDNIRTLFNQFEAEVRVLNVLLFKFKFSGEKEWLAPKDENITIFVSSESKRFKFEIQIDLDNDFPAVTFFDEEKLKERIDLRESQPVVKIELNEEIKIDCNIVDENQNCCLAKKNQDTSLISISIYNFLKHLKLIEATIHVDVCGVKNLIVQNDEGTLDIKSQLFPFGLRPEVSGFDPMNQATLAPKDTDSPFDRKTDPFLGPSFYIGSKEVLYKNWRCVRVNIEWKDKPESFHDHYKAYLKNNLDLNSPPKEESFGLSEDEFRLKINKLENGEWEDISKIKLFSKTGIKCNSLLCETAIYGWEVENNNDVFVDYNQPIEDFKNSLNGFLKFTLADQDFLHKEYPFVLARQMLAYALISDNKFKKLTDAIYIDSSNKTVITATEDIIVNIDDVEAKITSVINIGATLNGLVVDVIEFINDNDDILIQDIKDEINTELSAIITNLETYSTNLSNLNFNVLLVLADLSIPTLNNRIDEIRDVIDDFNHITNSPFLDLETFFTDLLTMLTGINGIEETVNNITTGLEELNDTIIAISNTNIFGFLLNDSLQALIPNEPWTPIIKNLYIDYSASAEKSDMDIIHLYPYENTSKLENIQSNPTLFPFYDNEGTLFIGIEDITVGGSLSILFQLAEATADSELDRAKIEWYYLSENTWVKLRPDFDVISDETDGLTVSGIVTIAIPDDINKEGNTLMPDDKYWIKVIAPLNAKAIAETIGIHTQAAKTSARLNELNDRNRLDTSIESGSIAKLVEGDFSVKKVEQLYPSFGGKTPEAGGHFYTRVSEHLKHKGRALMINDYEKIVLEGFPEIYKAKSISHTMGLSAHIYRRDLEIAPGYIVVTVIPDLTKLKAGNQLEPKAPLSLLEKIADHIRSKTSPFARLKVMNPRYEYVNVSISVRLYRGKSTNFYKQKLKEDLTLFLAPWFLGDSEKLAFGQNVIFSDVVGFVEQLDYVDFISNLQLKGECDQTGSIIRPLTARSVLTAGKMCVNINEESCPGQVTSNEESCFESQNEEISPKPESINKLSESI